ncbi:hypothetical protein L2X99_06490 [Microbacterium sp. KUDC0406]|uniref:hypothetical protein n=1 Tax=Microbacterium sp. KUDC0406 TaxID=2909588 RepID=UPI001F1A5A53|nr:hypothetical protein [Microbacterium sp. KUDC0406]UJP11201.1 hypothetical protein L2X99_06490 [Microbacterium sp. KUDC0406]
MNTSLLTPGTLQRQGHPPDTEDRQILTIPDADQRQHLTPADRLRLALGLWLLERTLRSDDDIVGEQEQREQITLERSRPTIADAQAPIYDLQLRLR